jgi:hypothetical protein
MLMGSKDGKKMSKLGSASIDFSKYIEQTDFAGIDLKSLQVCKILSPVRQPLAPLSLLRLFLSPFCEHAQRIRWNRVSQA